MTERGSGDADGGDATTPVPVPAPVVEADRWQLIETSERRMGHDRLVAVDSHQSLYGDHDLRERVRAATGRDRLWRGVFCARLTTTPPLTPGIADLVVRSLAFPRARSEFAADLADRGFADVTEAERRRLPVGDRRVRAVRFRARVPPESSGADAATDGDGDEGVAVDAWLALWDRDTDMVAAGGFYPVEPLPGAPDVFEAPETYRERLLAFLRAVDAT